MSHNSWTYLSPKTFLGKVFSFLAKCQSKTIKEQYEQYQVRVFDLRIRLNNKKQPTIAHGIFEYSIENLQYDLSFLNQKKASVRVLLEISSEYKDTEAQRNWFINYCKQLEEMYPNINFFGGRPAYCGIKYYKFKNENPTIKSGNASSINKNKLDDLWPWLYAKLNNKKILNQVITEDCLILDFVEIN